MGTYLVEVAVSGRELWHVDADSPEDARKNWSDGAIAVSEILDAEVVSVKPNPT